jgi:hypothetical protein
MDLNDVEYVIVDRGDLDAEALLNGMRIGYANCVRDGDRLLLADIKITEQMPCDRPTLFDRIRSIFGARALEKLRRRGVGGALLKCVLRAADSAGIHEIPSLRFRANCRGWRPRRWMWPKC